MNYPRDPRWMTAVRDGVDRNGSPYRSGEAVFYYPASQTALSGTAADQASRDFEAMKADEEFMSGFLL